MKEIDFMPRFIEDEVNDAEKYIRKALEVRAFNRSLADVLFNLSTEEIKHMNMLHSEISKIIEGYKAKGVEPPDDMMRFYEILHSWSIEDAKAVKILQNMYLE